MKKELVLLKELTQLHGVSGNEKMVRRYLESEYLKYTDDIIHDHLGSIFAYKSCGKKDAKKVMVVAHQDEVGLIVSHIYANGMLGFLPIGGLWNQTMLAQRLRILTRSEKEIVGAIGSIPPHLLSEAMRSKPMELANMLIDVGASSSEEVKEMGINIGDSIVVDGSFELLNGGKRILTKAVDNRYGCVNGLMLLESLKDTTLDFDLYVGASVQEEVGLRGAQTCATMINPDLAIVVDCSPANDAKYSPDANGQLGKGVLIRFHDRSMLPNRVLLEDFENVCEKYQIEYQFFYSPGGTDAGAIHKVGIGVPTLTICICGRNLHTNSTVIDAFDLQCAIQSLQAFIKELTPEKIERYQKGNQ